MQVFDAIRTRLTVREFKPDAALDEVVDRLPQTGRWAAENVSTLHSLGLNLVKGLQGQVSKFVFLVKVGAARGRGVGETSQLPEIKYESQTTNPLSLYGLTGVGLRPISPTPEPR